MFLATGILSSDKVHLDLKNRFLFGVQFCTFVQAHKTSKMATPNSFLKTGGKVFIKGIQNFIKAKNQVKLNNSETPKDNEKTS